MRSRLEKHVLYYHRGFAEDVGFTASFKPLLIRFAQPKCAAVVGEGWYVVKKVPNKLRLLVTPGDLEPLSRGDLARLAARMRVRFYRLVSSGVNSDKVAVVEPAGVPPSEVVALLRLRPAGEVEFARVLWIQLASELRGAEKVVASRNGGLLLVVVAT